MKNFSNVSIGFGSANIKIISLAKKGKKYVVDYYAVENLPRVKSQDIEEEKNNIISLIKKHFSSGKLKKVKEVNVIVPAQYTIFRDIALPIAAKDKIDQMISFEAEQQIPFPINEVEMAWQVVGETAENVIVQLVVIKRDKLDEFMEIILGAGLAPVSIGVSIANIYNFYCVENDWNNLAAQSGEENATKVIAFIDIGASSTDIAIVDKKRFYFTRSAPIAGNHLSDLIQKKLNVSIDQAEEIKRNNIDLNIISSEIIAKTEEESNASKISIPTIGKAKIPGGPAGGPEIPKIGVPKAPIPGIPKPGLVPPSVAGAKEETVKTEEIIITQAEKKEEKINVPKPGQAIIPPVGSPSGAVPSQPQAGGIPKLGGIPVPPVGAEIPKPGGIPVPEPGKVGIPKPGEIPVPPAASLKEESGKTIGIPKPDSGVVPPIKEEAKEEGLPKIGVPKLGQAIIPPVGSPSGAVPPPPQAGGIPKPGGIPVPPIGAGIPKSGGIPVPPAGKVGIPKPGEIPVPPAASLKEESGKTIGIPKPDSGVVPPIKEEAKEEGLPKIGVPKLGQAIIPPVGSPSGAVPPPPQAGGIPKPGGIPVPPIGAGIPKSGGIPVPPAGKVGIPKPGEIPVPPAASLKEESGKTIGIPKPDSGVVPPVKEEGLPKIGVPKLGQAIIPPVGSPSGAVPPQPQAGGIPKPGRIPVPPIGAGIPKPGGIPVPPISGDGTPKQSPAPIIPPPVGGIPKPSGVSVPPSSSIGIPKPSSIPISGIPKISQPITPPKSGESKNIKEEQEIEKKDSEQKISKLTIPKIEPQIIKQESEKSEAEKKVPPPPPPPPPPIFKNLGAAVLTEEEEKVEEQQINFDNKEIIKVTLPFFERFISEIKRSIDFFKNNNEGKEIEKIVIFGGASKIKGLKEFINKRLSINTEEINGSKIIEGLSGEEIYYYAAEIGSAINAFEKRINFEINLLPLDYKRQKEKEFQNKFLMLSGIAGLILLLEFGGIWWFKFKNLNTELEIYKKEEMRLKPVLDNIAKLQKLKKEVEKKNEIIDKITNERAKWLDVLAEFAKIIDNRTTWIETMNFNGKDLVSISGYTKSFEQIVNFINELNKSKYFKVTDRPVQNIVKINNIEYKKFSFNCSINHNVVEETEKGKEVKESKGSEETKESETTSASEESANEEEE
ncbi:MAG TPA: pilus assembly protein PilM [bacterium]|nr:pilus assembly protein PilM [bacterium]